MLGSPSPSPWQGSHTQIVVATVMEIWYRFGIRIPEPYLSYSLGSLNSQSYGADIRGNGSGATTSTDEPTDHIASSSAHMRIGLLHSGVGLILTNPEGAEFTYALRFRFEATNNEAEYEALIAGLRIAEEMGVKNLQANVDSRLVANQVNGTYVAKEADMIRYMEKKSTSFAHLSKQVLVEELKEKSINELEVLAVVEEEGNTWMTPIYEYLTEETLSAEDHGYDTRSVVAKALRTGYYWPTIDKDARACQDCQWIEAKPVATITGIQVKKFAWDNIVCRYRLPGEKISDNGKQFRDNPFKDWCEKLCIRQRFASVKHPQANGLVERANQSLGERIKAMLDARSKN
ncbi:reverse transcriptase domain-containing protein [Tanacetum coccineum]